MTGVLLTSATTGVAIGPTGNLGVGVLTLQTQSRRLVLICGDVIWFPDAMAWRLREGIARAANVDTSAVILAASHSHGSPQPEPRFPFGRSDPAWVARFERAVLATATEALAARPADVTLHFGEARISPLVAINRRRLAWYRDGVRLRRRVQSLPNAARTIDDRVSVLVARDGADAVRAIIVHAVCHPVTLPRDATGADFPGIIREKLQARFGAHVPVLFLQGHCGDIRPRLIHEPSGLKDHVIETLIGPRFRASREGDTETVGIAITRVAERAIAGAHALVPQFAHASSRLPLRDDAGASAGRDLDITCWRIAPGFDIVASSGEMLSGLASQEPGVLSVGYANGMAGYIAPASEYADGGYEIDGFLEAFGLQRRFSPGTERNFLTTRARLLAQIGHTRAFDASPTGADRATAA